jgi:hypothetical protein
MESKSPTSTGIRTTVVQSVVNKQNKTVTGLNIKKPAATICTIYFNNLQLLQFGKEQRLSYDSQNKERLFL